MSNRPTGAWALGHADEFNAPIRSMEQALADLYERLDSLPHWHPDMGALKTQIAGLENEIAQRQGL